MFSRRSAFWALVAAVPIAFALGWILGTWTSCRGGKCSFDADLFGAYGTWIGGLGTVGALIFAGRQVSAETRRERRQAADRAREAKKEQKRLRDEANRVSVRSWPYATSGSRVDEVAVRVKNDAHTTPIFDAVARIDDRGVRMDFGKVAALDAPRRSVSVRDWEPFLEEDQVGDEVTEMTRRTVLEFTMNGQKWKRSGYGDVELVADGEGPATAT